MSGPEIRRVKPASVASLGALAAVLIIGIAYLSFGVLRFDPFAEHTTGRMLLANSGSIGPGAPVLLTGIRVGEVTGVQKAHSGVEVVFQINEGYQVPANSTVKIENLSALGEPYIEFKPTDNRGPYIQDNQLLDTRDIQAPMLIPELSSRAVEFINQLDPAVMSRLVGTVDTALAGTEAQVPKLERATKLLAATILSRTDLIRQLLTDLQTAGADMEWTGPSLIAAGPYWTEFGERIEDVIGAGADLFEVGDAPNQYLTGDGLLPFLDRLTALLTKLGPELSELVPVLAPVAAQATATLGQLDIGALISQAVNTVGDDGAIHLRINVK